MWRLIYSDHGAKMFDQKMHLTPTALTVGVRLWGVCMTVIKWALSCSAPQEMNLTLLIYQPPLSVPSSRLSSCLFLMSLSRCLGLALIPPPLSFCFSPFKNVFPLSPLFRPSQFSKYLIALILHPPLPIHHMFWPSLSLRALCLTFF